MILSYSEHDALTLSLLFLDSFYNNHVDLRSAQYSFFDTEP